MSDKIKRTAPRVHDSESGKNNQSSYFLSLSRKYKKASHIIYILLAASFALTLMFNSRLLTYTNFNYLFRDLNSAAEVAAENYNSISYSNDEMRVVKAYRGGIITASSTDMAIYNASGRKTLYLSESFISPQIATSKKYAIVYDLGGNKYSVYNSFSRVGGEKLEYPISSVAVSDNGWFAIVSKDAQHSSVVYLYDDDLELRNTYYFANARVFCVDINDNGSKIAVFKTVTDIDKFSTSVMVCESGKDKSSFDVQISQGMVYGAGFLENGKIQVICTDGYYLIDGSDGKIVKSYGFDGELASRVSLADDGCAVVLSGITQSALMVFDKKGELACSTTVDSGMLDMEYYGGYVFVNQGEELLKINVKNGSSSSTRLSDRGNDIIVYDSKNILLCCPTKAKYIET